MADTTPPGAPGAAFRVIGEVLKSYATGPDGQSYAPGRLFAFIAFGVGQGLVVRAAASLLAGRPSVADWNAFFQGVGMFEFAIASVAVALVMGIAPADPGGRWWGKGPGQ
jgi:hypothetical protein